MNIEQELLKLGLNEKEATIYMALLGTGPATAGNIAVYTKIKRSTTYLALSNLISLGLVTERYKKKRLFSAEPPTQLKKLTNRMRRKLIQAELLLDNLVPALEDLPKSVGNTETPQLSFREGMGGIKNVLLEVASSKTSWYVFGSSSRLLQSMPVEDLKEVLEEGEKLRELSGRPKIYFITDKGILSVPAFSKPDPRRREIKVLPVEIKTSSAYIIYGSKVAILHISPKPFVTVIESKEIAELMKLTYKLIWGSLA